MAQRDFELKKAAYDTEVSTYPVELQTNIYKDITNNHREGPY